MIPESVYFELKLLASGFIVLFGGLSLVLLAYENWLDRRSKKKKEEK